MNFVESKYKKYSFNLKLPFQNSTETIKQKQVIIIKAKDELGNYHFGEIGPLKGFSTETIEDCEVILDEIFIDRKSEVKISELKSSLPKFHKYPSLLFGLEQLVFSVDLSNYFTRLNNYDMKKIVKVNGVVGIGSLDSTLKEVQNLVNQGYETIKLKIGRKNFNTDFEVIKKLKYIYGDKIQLRIDNNGSWEFDEAIINIAKLNEFGIEYIEQPVEKLEELLKLASICDLPVAADECIVNYEDALRIIKSGTIKYVILKPTIRIGLFNAIKLIELANKINVKIIISSAFETVIARATLIYLASLADHKLGNGLNTELLGIEEIKSKTVFNTPNFEITNHSFLNSTQVYF